MLKQKGFTLVELLVVVVVLSIIATGAVLGLDPLTQIRKSNDTKRKADLTNVQRALEQYYNDFGRYPVSSSDFKIIKTGTTGVGWGTSGFSPYMDILPKDSNGTKNYVYYSSGQAYYLYASLDNAIKDVSSCQYGTSCVGTACACPKILSPGGDSGFPGVNACGSVCDYGVTSPNVSP